MNISLFSQYYLLHFDSKQKYTMNNYNAINKYTFVILAVWHTYKHSCMTLYLQIEFYDCICKRSACTLRQQKDTCLWNSFVILSIVSILKFESSKWWLNYIECVSDVSDWLQIMTTLAFTLQYIIETNPIQDNKITKAHCIILSYLFFYVFAYLFV